MKSPTESDLPPDLLLSGLPLLPLDLPLLSSVGGGSEGSVVEERGRGEGEREGKSEREVELAKGCGDDKLGEATVRERVRERENRVRELKQRMGSENNNNR